MPTDEDGLSPAQQPARRPPWRRRPGNAAGRRRRGWKGWLPLIAKPLRRGVLIFIILLIIEYLVVPELTGASKDLSCSAA